jgi:nicotinamide mononucleotide (NMN) deamidase PncC
VGTVYVALAGMSGTEVVHRVWRGDRDRVRKTTAYQALDMLRRATRA